MLNKPLLLSWRIDWSKTFSNTCEASAAGVGALPSWITFSIHHFPVNISFSLGWANLCMAIGIISEFHGRCKWTFEDMAFVWFVWLDCGRSRRLSMTSHFVVSLVLSRVRWIGRYRDDRISVHISKLKYFQRNKSKIIISSVSRDSSDGGRAIANNDKWLLRFVRDSVVRYWRMNISGRQNGMRREIETEICFEFESPIERIAVSQLVCQSSASFVHSSAICSIIIEWKSQLWP